MPTSTARRRTLSTAVVMAALVMATTLIAGPAQAGGDPGILCRASSNAPVFRADGAWMYTIKAGRDMRVTQTRYPGERMQLFGHGAGQSRNGWAKYWHFSFCR